MERICKHCGFKRGEHKARTLHCPLSGGSFSQFHRTQVFEADAARKKKPDVAIDRAGNSF